MRSTLFSFVVAMLLQSAAFSSHAQASSTEPDVNIMVPFSFESIPLAYVTLRYKNYPSDKGLLPNTKYHAFNPIGFEIFNPNAIDYRTTTLRDEYTKYKQNWIPKELGFLEKMKKSTLAFMREPNSYTAYVVGTQDSKPTAKPLNQLTHSNIWGAVFKDGSRMDSRSYSIRLCKNSIPTLNILYSESCILVRGIRFKDVIHEIDNPTLQIYGRLYKMGDPFLGHPLGINPETKKGFQYIFDFAQEHDPIAFSSDPTSKDTNLIETWDWIVGSIKERDERIKKYNTQPEKVPFISEKEMQLNIQKEYKWRQTRLNVQIQREVSSVTHTCDSITESDNTKVDPENIVICPSIIDGRYKIGELLEAGYKVKDVKKTSISPHDSWLGKIGLKTNHFLEFTITK